MSNRPYPIKIDSDLIGAFCRENGIRTLSLFGSILRDDFGPASDVDILIEFETGRTPGLAFFRMQRELSALLGRDVDLSTPAWLSHRFRDEVLSEAEPVYAAA